MTQPVEKRANLRKPWEGEIVIITLDHETKAPKEFKARTFDISPTGIGLQLDTRLKQGQLVGFAKDQKKWEFPSQGRVVWSMRAATGYRAGLEFIL